MFTCVFAAGLVVGAPALKDKPADGPPLVGRWECTALSINGRADPQWQGLAYEFTAAGGWVIYRDGKDIGGISRTYATDPEAGPGAIDVCELADGVAQPSLYKVDGDTLTLSSRTEKGGARPADFQPGAGLMTFTFRRVKAKD
jgi:uncharacterized protein (TIGR03067 family)